LPVIDPRGDSACDFGFFIAGHESIALTAGSGGAIHIGTRCICSPVDTSALVAFARDEYFAQTSYTAGSKYLYSIHRDDIVGRNVIWDDDFGFDVECVGHIRCRFNNGRVAVYSGFTALGARATSPHEDH